MMLSGRKHDVYLSPSDNFDISILGDTLLAAVRSRSIPYRCGFVKGSNTQNARD